MASFMASVGAGSIGGDYHVVRGGPGGYVWSGGEEGCSIVGHDGRGDNRREGESSVVVVVCP